MSARTKKLAALLLPLVVLAAMILRAEIIIRMGRTYEVDIQGYDPRDLLRGHYLRYRVAWNGSPNSQLCYNEDCCVCIGRGGPAVNPGVMGTSCSAVENCEAFIRREEMKNLEQYFVPQEHAADLERRIRDRRASLRIAISRKGDVVVEDLLIDGIPWQEAR